MADSALWESLDRELNAMVEHFSNLVRAAAVPDEEGEQMVTGKRDRAPGDLLELFAERLVHSGHSALHLASQLKRGAMTTDFKTLMDDVRAVRNAFDTEVAGTGPKLAGIRREAEALLADLEHSYYSSSNRGELVTTHVSRDLHELARLALDGL